MAKNKGIYKLFRTRAELDYYEANIRDHTRQWTIDLVTIALGRMGFRETRMLKFAETLTGVLNEFAEATLNDFKDDKSMWYSQDLIERELKEYCGESHAPKEVRYR